MFSKLLSAVLIAAPFANALQIITPSGWTSGGPATIQWNSADGDPTTWSFFLVNSLFHNTYAIANTVNPTTGEVNVTLPIVPVDGNYQLEATNVSNQSDIFASVGPFAIGALVSTTTSGSSTIVQTISAATSTGVTNTIPPTGTVLSQSIVSPSGGSSTSSGSSSSSTGPAPSTTPLNNGAAGKTVSGAALALLVAGAGFLAL